MKKTVGLVVLSYLVISCQEYTSYHPIGEPEESTIRSPYNGKWVFVSAMNQDKGDPVNLGPHYMLVRPFNRYEFLVQLLSDSIKSLKDIDHFRGYVSTVDDVMIATASPLDEPDKRPVYSVYRFSLIDDTLRLSGISSDKFDSLNVFIGSEKDHRKFIRSAIVQPELWDMEYVYTRKQADE